MKRHLVLHTLTAVLACSAALADEKKGAVAKSESKDGTATAYAYAEARATSSSTSTTVINGKPVTIIEDQDENGRKRLRMITVQGGRAKVKDITPKEKAPKEDSAAKKKPVEDAKPRANAKPAGDSQ